MDDTFTSVLLNGYGLKLFSVSKSRAGFICKTDDGLKELRKSYLDKNNIIFEKNIREHLLKNCFNNIHRLTETLTGEAFYSLDDVNYILEEYVPVNDVDFSDDYSIKKAASLLAEFHKKSQGLVSECKNTGLDVKSLHEKRIRELKSLKRRISKKQRYSDADIMVLKHYFYCIEKYNISKEILENITPCDNHSNFICHNNYRCESLRMTNDKYFYLEGLEKCEYNNPITDLSDLIRRYSKYDYCKPSIIYEIISEYNSILPITKNDILTVKAMLIFPQKFLKLLNECYNKRRSFVSEAIIKKMDASIMQSECNLKTVALLDEILKV